MSTRKIPYVPQQHPASVRFRDLLDAVTRYETHYRRDEPLFGVSSDGMAYRARVDSVPRLRVELDVAVDSPLGRALVEGISHDRGLLEEELDANKRFLRMSLEAAGLPCPECGK